MIPEPEHLEPIAIQTGIPHHIFLPLDSMSSAINLDDQPIFKAHEIHDIAFDGLLPAKFHTFHPLCFQVLPQDSFRVGGFRLRALAFDASGEKSGY